jgi:ADP-ribose pyrophosphatase
LYLAQTEEFDVSDTKLQKQENPWRTLSTARKYEDDFFAVDEHQVLNAAGHVAPYGVVHFKKRGVRILPIDDDGFLFIVGQFRYAAQYYSWELSAGGGETSENMKEAAARELEEELGFHANHWLELLHHVPSGSLVDCREVTYLAWGLTPTKRHPDEQEVLQIKRVRIMEAVRLVLDGTIEDSGSAAAILALFARMNFGELPQELLPRLVDKGLP